MCFSHSFHIRNKVLFIEENIRFYLFNIVLWFLFSLKQIYTVIEILSSNFNGFRFTYDLSLTMDFALFLLFSCIFISINGIIEQIAIANTFNKVTNVTLKLNSKPYRYKRKHLMHLQCYKAMKCR